MSDLLMKRSAIIRDGCRFELRRVWGGGPLAAWLMCNPSYADSDKDDPTMLRVIHFSRSWGYAGVIVLNCFPYISPSIPELKRWLALGGKDGDTTTRLINENVVYIQRALEGASHRRIVAFGNTAFSLPKAREAINEFQKRPCYSLGQTKHGAPIHPLARGKHRVPNNAVPKLWEVEA